ncbi:FAD-dependent oxidoreductase [Leadbettera azotonutricia]|uniref:NADH:ubiquinone reductase (non-electrogenic) n=1 Tax=Leadbettera azotonutricia (strain ATCC BAA-888 / DSM 13862 / ZAS-9) TaxID=545695 RepID=F5YBV8_LEAAZ|nr:FAD-dependent oxidoreductase [Leadbettera azotonutricia]AEF81317.1 NADH dehydrogenase, FAD-binding subunit [Leadbettera azotonutricia ZAS-9]
MGNGKNILIVGGGYGGISAAKKLEKKYKHNDDVTITLVDKRPFHTLMTELHEVAGHRVEPDSVRVPYAKVFGASKVKVSLDTIDSIDFGKNQARSATKVYDYDYLVLGSGAEPNFFGIPGIKENSFTLWSFDDAMKLRYHIDDVFEKAVAEQDRAKRQKMLTFVVAGAGFTGIEMAGELIEWRDTMCAKWLVPVSEVRIIVVEALNSILPILEEDLRDKVEHYMKKHGAELLTGTAIVGGEPGLVKLKDGSALATSTFIWTAGVDGNTWADGLGLSNGPFGKDAPEGKRNRRGRLLITDEIRSVDHPNVFPVGDNIWFIENEKPLPQIVETAVQTGETAAHNIIAAIDGSAPKKFKSNFHGFMVSVGGKYAVSNAMGIKLSGLFAMAMKHIVNLHYLIGVAGFNQCWEYLKHEFLNNDSGRTIVHGFGSYKTRGYWLLPIRLWLGLMWVFEGINKIGEGWLNWAQGSKSGWMFSSGIVQSGVPPAADDLFGAAEDLFGSVAVEAADAVSSATVTVNTTFEGVWDFSRTIFATDGAVATWFRTTFMDNLLAYVPFQGFQLMVVLVEILIGLALVGGLFTWWAAAVSCVMCVIFSLSGLFYWYQLWFLFAGILFLGGGGRAFGLDCWVVPFFKKWWNGTKIARRLYWYQDGPSK